VRKENSGVGIMKVRQALLSLCLGLTVLGESASAEPLNTDAEQALDNLPAVAGYFESVVKRQGKKTAEQQEQWYFWREAAHVETRNTSGEVSELWQRHQNGQISYQLIFHDDQLVIDYTAAELQAAQRYPQWSDLTSIIDPLFLKTHLKNTGAVKTLGRQAQRYQGQVGDVKFEVWWLENERMPALLRQVYPDGELTVQLRALYPLDDAPWLPSQIEHYAHLDFEDLDEQETAVIARSSHQDQDAFSLAP